MKRVILLLLTIVILVCSIGCSNESKFNSANKDLNKVCDELYGLREVKWPESKKVETVQEYKENILKIKFEEIDFILNQWNRYQTIRSRGDSILQEMSDYAKGNKELEILLDKSKSIYLEKEQVAKDYVEYNFRDVVEQQLYVIVSKFFEGEEFLYKKSFLQDLDYKEESVAAYDVYCEGISNLVKQVDAIIVRIEQLKNVSADSKSKFDEFKIKYNEGKLSHKKLVEREKKHIAVSEFVRLAAKTELQKHITIIQFKNATIIDRDEYDRYVVEVTAVGQNLFGALLTKNFYVLVYDVSEKGYSSSALMSYVDAWSGELRTLKAINNWGNLQK